MATTGRKIRTTRTRSAGANIEFPNLKRVLVKQGITLKTTGAAADQATISLKGLDITKYHVNNVRIVSRTAAGTLAAATVGLFTAAAAGGTGIVATAVLGSLTAANKIQASTVAAHDPLTAQTLYVYQNVDSANAGTVDVYVEIFDLSDLDS